MKTTLRSFVFILLAVAGGMTPLLANAQGTDDAMPPEVKALIGMKLSPVRVEGRDIKRAPWTKPLPPDYVKMVPPSIPNFVDVASAVIPVTNVLSARSDCALGYYLGDANGKWPVFLIDCTYPDMSVEILDVQMLSENLIEWKYIGGKRKFLEDRFQFSDSCETRVGDSRIIFGLVKPEKGKLDVSHDSIRVKQAWQIDEQSGRIAPISTKELQCHYFMGDN